MTKTQKIILIVLIVLVIGGTVYYFMLYKPKADKKKQINNALLRAGMGQSGWIEALDKMSNSELDTVYEYMVTNDGKDIEAGTPLAKAILAIQTKYKLP